MNRNSNRTIILATTFLLAASIIVVSLIAILTGNFYAKETLTWQIQSFGQDIIDLFLITPALIVTGIMSAKKNRIAFLLWAGTLLYIIYTFTIYCFDVHFNTLFPIYCLILCISFYSFVWFIYIQVKHPVTHRPCNRRTAKLTGIYFIVIATLFYFLWLSEIIPPIIKNGIPENIKVSGLPTNPVHVIDLSFFLPAVFITGLFVLRQNPAGPVCATILLSFFILMDITIGWLAFKMYQQGLASNLIVLFVMIFLTAISTVLLFYNLKGNHPKTELLRREPNTESGRKTIQKLRHERPGQ